MSEYRNPRINPDEELVYRTAIGLGIEARYATLEENHGHKKADVAMFDDNGKIYYFQVSRNPKSNREREHLIKKLGTIPISTHDSGGRRLTPKQLEETIGGFFREK